MLPIAHSLFGYATLLTAVLASALLMTGVPTAAALKISAYLFFLVMPLGGYLVKRSCPARGDAVVRAGLGTAVGVLLHPLTVVPFYVLGITQAHWWAICIAAAVVWSLEFRDKRNFAHAPSADVKAFWIVVAFATLIAVTCFLATSNLPDVLAHFRVQAIGVEVLAAGWPPENPYVAGLPYRDNFGVHLSLLAIAQGADISIADLGGYAAQLAYLWLAIMTLGLVGRYWLGLSIVACVAAMIACNFILGFSPINFLIYGSTQSTAASMTLSPLLGHMGFLLSLWFFATLVSDPQIKPSRGNVLALVSLGAATMLARANAGALLGLSVSAYWLCRVASTRGLQPRIAVYVLAVGAGCIGAMLFSLGSPVGGEFSGAGFLRFGLATLEYLSLNGYPVSRLAQSAGFSVVAAGALAFTVIVLLYASFLAPFFWVRTVSILRGAGSTSEILILLSVGLGILATLFTFATGGSNFVFLQLAKLGMCLLGGAGLDAAIASWRRGSRSGFSTALWVVVLGLAGIHFYDAELQRRKLEPLSRLWAPAPAEALLGKPFDMPPILETIRPTKGARFIVVHGDEGTWGSGGRVSATILYYGLRVVAHDQVVALLSFAPNRTTERLEKLWQDFSKLKAGASNGVLDLPCAVEMANSSFGYDREIYILSAKGLRVIGHPAVTRRAESRDLIAWQVSASGPETSSSACR